MSEMQLVNIGFGNLVSLRRLIAIVSPDSAPVKRLVQESRDRGMLIDATYEDVDPVRHQRVIDRVAFYKNLRSVLDEVEYYDAGGLATEYFGAACIGCELVDSAAAIRY